MIGTPIDLARVIDIEKENVRVTYDLDEEGDAFLARILKAVESKNGKAQAS